MTSRTLVSVRVKSLMFLTCPSTRNSKSSSLRPVMATPLESTTDAGIGTRFELTRTVSEGSTSSFTALGRESFAGVCGLELGVPGVWPDAPAGSEGALRFEDEGFAVLSVFRPDCAITTVGRLKQISQKSMDRQRIVERSCGFMRKPEEPVIESVAATCP